MIEGIGIDIIEIQRIKKAMGRNEKLIYRIFTQSEIDYCCSKKDPYPHFAARFAAKEAVAKALKMPLVWKEVEVVNEKHGNIIPQLYGKSQQILGDRNILISISHSRDNAVAVAVLMSSK